jgi:hypothetical protein
MRFHRNTAGITGCARLPLLQEQQGSAQVLGILVVFEMLQVRLDNRRSLPDNVSHDLVFIVRGRFAILDRDGSLRAMTQASAQTVAEKVADQAGFARDDLDGSFRAVWQTLAAAIALRFIDLDYSSPVHGR